LRFVGNLGDARSAKPLHQRIQLPQPSRIQHRDRALRSTAAEHVCRIGVDRAWRPIRQLDHQQQHAVPSLKRPRRQQVPEQRMRLRDHPHLARQYRTQLLQSVAFTPGTGKTHLAIGIAIRACQAGHRVLFATASEWVARLAEAHHAGRLQQELIRLGRYPLLVVDEVGYIPFEPEAANLFFQLVSSRYERASLIVTSNKPFGRWGEVFGDDVVAAAMIDRLVHHAEVIALKGDSYRIKDRDLGRVPGSTTEE
jgi:IstB-like ATP binding protein